MNNLNSGKNLMYTSFVKANKWTHKVYFLSNTLFYYEEK